MSKPIALSLSFPTGKVAYHSIAAHRNKKSGPYRLAGMAGKTGRLYIGETYLGRAEVKNDGTSIAVSPTLPDTPPLEEHLAAARLRLNLRIAKGWIKPDGKEFRHGSLLRLDTAMPPKGDLIYSGTDTVLARGEVVTIDGFYGLRIEELAPPPVPEPGERGLICCEVLLGGVDLTAGSLDQLGEGTLLQTDADTSGGLDLLCGSVPVARGVLRAYAERKTDFRQAYAVWADAGEPGLFFKVTEAVVPELQNRDRREPGQAYRLGPQIRSLSEASLASFAGSLPASAAAYLAKYTAVMDPERAARLAEAMTRRRGDAFLIDFFLCDPSGVIPEVPAQLAEDLAALYGNGAGEPAGGTEGQNVEFPSPYDPVGQAAQALCTLPMAGQRKLMETLQKADPALAEEAGTHFLFPEDLQEFPDRALQTLLREIDSTVLVSFLNGSSEDLQEKFLSNVSSRSGKAIREEMALKKEQPAKIYEKAAEQILSIVYKLYDAGDIVL